MRIEYSLGEIIAALALVISFYATWRTFRFKKSEQELVEIQKKLNTFMLEKEQRDAEQATRAELGAAFVTLGAHKHRLKVFNKGKATAYQVNLNFPEGNDVILQQDIQEKLPLESLERGQSVELIAAVTLSTKRKHAIELLWHDEDGIEHSKVVHATL